MSIERCDKHDRNYDTDTLDNCPLCAADHVELTDLLSAQYLATLLWEKHYKNESPNWKPLDTIEGLLSQINNMTSGMARITPPDSLAVAQALEEWESTFDCNAPQEAYAEMEQAVLAHINKATAQALEAVKKIGRDLQLEPIPDWSQQFKDGYREGISEYVHRINAFAPTSAAETRRQVKKRRAARKQST